MYESDLSSFDFEPDFPISFRHALEKITNHLDPIPNRHFEKFLSHYT
jgi:hypothetical protein